MKLKFFSILYLIASLSYTQNKPYARAILDTLCSSNFDGRGYYNSGEKRAAEFIKNEYQKIGLKPIENSYLQNFNISVNTITGKIKLKTDNQLLTPGTDYIVHPSSPSICKKVK